MRKLFLIITTLFLSITTNAQFSNEELVRDLFRVSPTQGQPATILANGHLVANTFGKLVYFDPSMNFQEIPFLYQNGMIYYTDIGFTKLSTLQDSCPVQLWLCLKSPVFKSNGTYWDTMMVMGTFGVEDLCIKSDNKYIRLKITTLRKRYYKITLESNGIKIVYKDIIPHFLWKKRIDNKDCHIYNRHYGVWGPPLW